MGTLPAPTSEDIRVLVRTDLDMALNALGRVDQALIEYGRLCDTPLSYAIGPDNTGELTTKAFKAAELADKVRKAI
jgi:hypothetical protein